MADRRRPYMRYLSCGIGSSHRAIEAEREGRVPATKISSLIDDYPIILQAFKTKKQAKEWIIANYGGEWHHTSKYGNKTDFYDVAGAAETLQDFMDGEIDYVPGLFVRKSETHKRKVYPAIRTKSAQQSYYAIMINKENYIMPDLPEWVLDNSHIFFYDNGYYIAYKYQIKEIYSPEREKEKKILAHLGFIVDRIDIAYYRLSKKENLNGFIRLH